MARGAYLYETIISFRHKGLKLYYEKGDTSKLQQQHAAKIRLILTRLDAAKSPLEMQVPGYNFQGLIGNYEGCWSVKVSGNFRIIFRFAGENACDVDYLDYH